MVNVKYTVIVLILYLMVHSIVLNFEKIWLSATLNIIFHIYRSGVMALFLLENRDFFRFPNDI
jgi:hypothetical protein